GRKIATELHRNTQYRQKVGGHIGAAYLFRDLAACVVILSVLKSSYAFEGMTLSTPIEQIRDCKRCSIATCSLDTLVPYHDELLRIFEWQGAQQDSVDN